MFDASETIVAEVMRPRADVAFLDGSMPIAEAAAYVREMPYSRYPVTGKDFDDVLGFVHVRDLLDIRDPKARTVADVRAFPCRARRSCCQALSCCANEAFTWPW